jgi:hypothetical protein
MPNLTLEQCQSQVGPGWSDLVAEIYAALPEDAYICQVKEKWGGLRFYIGAGTRELWDLIDDVEARSYTVCEQCGKPGKLRPGGWVLTLCDECNGKRGK